MAKLDGGRTADGELTTRKEYANSSAEEAASLSPCTHIAPDRAMATMATMALTQIGFVNKSQELLIPHRSS